MDRRAALHDCAGEIKQMKWHKKYDLDLKEIHDKNKEGFSLPELSVEYGVPRTTLNRYLRDAGYKVYFNRHRGRITAWRKRQKRTEFACVNTWKRRLVEKFGNACCVCGYDRIVEAHHIVPQEEGGRHTSENGILLCPNHHAEVHAGFLKTAQLEVAAAQAMRQTAAHIKRTCDFETR